MTETGAGEIPTGMKWLYILGFAGVATTAGTVASYTYQQERLIEELRLSRQLLERLAQLERESCVVARTAASSCGHVLVELMERLGLQKQIPTLPIQIWQQFEDARRARGVSGSPSCYASDSSASNQMGGS